MLQKQLCMLNRQVVNVAVESLHTCSASDSAGPVLGELSSGGGAALRDLQALPLLLLCGTHGSASNRALG